MTDSQVVSSIEAASSHPDAMPAQEEPLGVVPPPKPPQDNAQQPEALGYGTADMSSQKTAEPEQQSQGTGAAGQQEPVRTEPKPSAKLQPTAALVYPWISASMRRGGTGTASFRTAAAGQYAGMPPSALKSTPLKRVSERDGTQATNTPISTPSRAASPQIPSHVDSPQARSGSNTPTGRADSSGSVPRYVAGIEAAVGQEFGQANHDTHASAFASAAPAEDTVANSTTAQPAAQASEVDAPASVILGEAERDALSEAHVPEHVAGIEAALQAENESQAQSPKRSALAHSSGALESSVGVEAVAMAVEDTGEAEAASTSAAPGAELDGSAAEAVPEVVQGGIADAEASADADIAQLEEAASPVNTKPPELDAEPTFEHLVTEEPTVVEAEGDATASPAEPDDIADSTQECVASVPDEGAAADSTEPPTEPTDEPIAEPAAELITEPSPEPTAEPTTDPTVEPAAGPVSQETADQEEVTTTEDVAADEVTEPMDQDGASTVFEQPECNTSVSGQSTQKSGTEFFSNSAAPDVMSQSTLPDIVKPVASDASLGPQESVSDGNTSKGALQGVAEEPETIVHTSVEESSPPDIPPATIVEEGGIPAVADDPSAEQPADSASPDDPELHAAADVADAVPKADSLVDVVPKDAGVAEQFDNLESVAEPTAPGAESLQQDSVKLSANTQEPEPPTDTGTDSAEAEAAPDLAAEAAPDVAPVGEAEASAEEQVETDVTPPEAESADPNPENEVQPSTQDSVAEPLGDSSRAAGGSQDSIDEDINAAEAAAGGSSVDSDTLVAAEATAHLAAVSESTGTAAVTVGGSDGPKEPVGPDVVSHEATESLMEDPAPAEGGNEEATDPSGTVQGSRGDAGMHDDSPVAARRPSSPGHAPHDPIDSRKLTAGRKAEESRPANSSGTIPTGPRVLAPAATNCDHKDVLALSQHIASEAQPSSTAKDLDVCLNGATLGLAVAEQDLSTAQAAAKELGDVWPTRCNGNTASVMHFNVASLYELGPCPNNAAVCSIQVGASSDKTGEVAQHSITLGDGTIALSKNDCLVFSGGCSSFKLSQLTFQGGVIVLDGEACKLEFEQVGFQGATLVVMNGAQAKLSGCRFFSDQEFSDIIQLYIDGANSSVELVDCNLDGGRQCIAVHHGASLKGSNTHCNAAAILGIEVRDLDSTATLNYCSVHDTGAPLEYPDSRFTYGMVVQAGATASLSECSIDGGGRGLVVAVGLLRETPAASATATPTGHLPTGSPQSLSQAPSTQCGQRTPRNGAAVMPLQSSVVATRCGFKYTVDCCVYCEDSADLTLIECDIEGSRMMHGLWVSNKASATAERSMFVGNAQDGVFVCAGGHLTAKECETEGNRTSGFKVTFGGGQLNAIDCKSTGEPIGCEVSKPGSSVVIENMTVKDCRGCAFDVAEGASAELKGCVVNGSTFSCVTVRAPADVKMTGCTLEGGYKGHGLLVEGNGAVVEAVDCKFLKNGISGVAVGNEAQVKLMQCSTENNKASGYQAAFKGQLSLFDCSCDADTDGCVTTGDGTKLTGEKVVARVEGFGFLANVSSRMNLKECLAEQCGQAGFCVEKKARMKMAECKSIGNLTGCSAMRGGSIVTATDSLFISNKQSGVDVADGAQAEFQGCTVSKCAQHCMRVQASAATIVGSVFERSETSHGLMITNSSNVEVTECKFTDNKGKGVCVGSKADVSVQECEAACNGEGGFWVESAGSLSILNSLSNEDTLGCGASEPGSQLTCDKLNVVKSVTQGFLALAGAKAELSECVALDCGGDGVAVVESGTELVMHFGRVENNGCLGVAIRNGAFGVLHEVSSGGNREGGFGSCGQGSVLNAVECVSSDNSPFVRTFGGRIGTRGGKQVDPATGEVEARAGGLRKWKSVTERKK